ncbi:S8 family peptidase [Ascidiimonas aurantiaca]|uniref:S8 family peptidase n=1 Tax=Ascidiimonas aurantiaca TaxID=1685432 RepID=UPI0030ED50D8
MKYVKHIMWALAASIILGCGSTAIISTPIEVIDTTPAKVAKPTEDELKKWHLTDLITDTLPGMSVERVHKELLTGRKGKTVIVGVIDSGVDIEHEDLAGVVWTNKKEKPGNGKDDDQNGYIDDIHGWNFLGNSVHENLEFVRILKKGDDGSDQYKEAKAYYEKEYGRAQQEKQQVDLLLQQIPQAEKAVKDFLGKETYTDEDLKGINSEDEKLARAKGLLLFLSANDLSYEKIKEYGEEALLERIEYNLNPDFDGRSIVGDNPADFTDRDYGDNNVMGPDKEKISHGTHVAGIIAAIRNNGKGINGVAHNVEIMAIRAVPNGDEYDKDIALAIRYAVDNGAKVINTSFGKFFSPNPEWVHDAIKYAASKDVLIVNAAGNDTENIDMKTVYPNDENGNGGEIADNFITIGALNYNYNGELIANFSNYGKNNVDIFAPGVKIWSTMPDNEYDFSNGTSMAAPGVAGIAALIRSYYPKLSAPQVKRILMESGLDSKLNLSIGKNNEPKTLKDISVSGRIANAYNAIIMADKVSRGVINL